MILKSQLELSNPFFPTHTSYFNGTSKTNRKRLLRSKCKGFFWFLAKIDGAFEINYTNIK
jgi:hypothetical protein